MKKNILTTMKREIVILGILLLCVNFISAFGVSSLYYPGNPLKLMPGEARNITLVLQSSESSDTTLKATVAEGSDILKIMDSSDTYIVPVQGRQTVNLQVTLPKNAKAGTVYPVKVSLSQIVKNGGMIGFATAIDQHFDVVVTKNPNIFDNLMQNNTWIYLIGGLLVVGLACFVVARKKKSKKLHHKRR